MASRSPANEAEEEAYENGWAALSRLMDSGASWSGRERHCAYLNLGEAGFVDVSGVSGLDFIDDGRALAATDWDGDGAVDLWLAHRTGPRLRFLRNQSTGESHFAAFTLRGVTCNRDGVGARVTLVAGDRQWSREVRAGEGYLAQSSTTLTFGLGAVESLEDVIVTWPGGEEEHLGALAVDRRWSVVQGAGEAVELPARGPLSREAGPFWPERDSAARVVLRTPLPLAPKLQAALYPDGVEGRARLVNLWASWCAPCVEELGAFARRSDELSYVGLDVLAVAVDPAGDGEAAAALFEDRIAPLMAAEPFGPVRPEQGVIDALLVLLESVLRGRDATALPVSLLIDRDDLIQVVYLGPVGVDRLLEDAHAYGIDGVGARPRSSHPGRWFYGMPRNLGALAAELESAGRGEEAAYYRALLRVQRSGRGRR
ncbi:MAG: ASPIC/UnbV domain-containing protein [Planctomycetota bacterium]|nr:ASPIC/UnbV domain-containing protein [Planctomycetota bacterium]MDP6987942.1 ASPIC/UnbV domain-containing protein [Planctomycetota bacterium]